MRSALAVCAIWSLLACAPASETTTATLELHALPSCELVPSASIMLSAAGDFPTQREPFSARASKPLADFFPPSTRWLGVEAEGAGGLVALESGGLKSELKRSVLMLPFGRSCPLGDPLAAAPLGAAVAPLAGGGLLIAGGIDANGIASSRAVVLLPGAALVTELVNGMLLRRAGATATPVGTRVLVAGGSQGNRYPANDTFEVYDGALQAFDMAQTGRLVAGPRRDHAAARLGDGRVLIVGGQSEPMGEPLASAELIDVERRKGATVRGALGVARVAPSVLVLDSGAVLVALGTEGSSADGSSGVLVPTVERFDPESELFEGVATLPTHAAAAVAALEGDRVVYVGCDGASCELALLGPASGGFSLLGPAQPLALELEHGLEQLRLLPLHDGRLLLTGRDPLAAIARKAFVIDLNTLAVVPQEPAFLSRVPERLLELEDGTRVELDAAGASLARLNVASELDDPPALLVGEKTLHVALDAAGHWEARDGLHAKSNARLDLPHLRFADARITLELEGAGALLFEPDRAPAVELAIGAKTLSLGSCELLRGQGAITVERHGNRLALHSGNNTRSCDAPPLNGRMGVALRVETGGSVNALSIKRL